MKRKFLSLAVALLCSVATWADGWTDSDGATVGTGEFYFYNVGSDRFLTQGCWWGTHMSSDGVGKVVTISGTDGAYNLHMAGINANQWLSGGDYVDTDVASGKTVTTDDNLKWTFALVDGTSHTYTIKNNSTNKYIGSIASTLYNTGHSVESAESASSNKYYWILIPKANRETLTGATLDNPIDATHLVTNPDGEYYIRLEEDAWKEYTHGGWSGNFSHNSSNESGYYASFYEIWTGTAATGNGTQVGNNWHLNNFDEYNNITGLPNGKYRVTMTAEATQQGDAEEITGAYIYANDKTTSVTTRGNYDVECVTADGTIKAGMKTVSTTANWVSFDNLRLTYYGNAVEVYSPNSFISGSPATASMWYECTISKNGVYKISSTNAATIYYTQDDSDDADETANVAIAASGSTLLTLATGTLYFKSGANSTITIEPFVLDGTYYLYDATNKVFLGRGANNGTRAVVDKYGVPFTWTSSPGLISFVDWSDTYLFFDKSNHADCWVYTDGAASKADDRLMTFTDAGDGKVYLQDKAKAVYIKHDNSVLNVPVASAASATKWTIMTVAEHDEIVNAYPTDNISSVITNAGISAAATTETFEDYLSNKCKNYDLTSIIGTATFGENAGDWTVTEVINANYSSWVEYSNGYARYWQDGVTATQTIGKANLPAGIYKITMAAFDRRGDANSVNSVDIPLGNTYGSVCSSYLNANGEQVRIKSWKETLYDIKKCNGSELWNVQAGALDDGTCDNVLYIYLDGNTDLTLKVAKPNLCPGNYFCFGNFTLTRYVYDSKVDAITTNKGDITSLINGTFQENTDGWSGGGHVTWVGERGWRGDNATKYYERSTNGPLSYTINNMPAGTYKVVAAARGYDGGTITPEIAGSTGSTLTCVGDTRSEKSGSEINTNGVEMPYSSLGGFTANANGHNWKWITATGTLAADGDLVINFNCVGTSWMGIDDVHLYCTNLGGTSYTTSLNGISSNTDVSNTGNRSVVTCDIVVTNPNVVFKSNSGAAITSAAGQLNNCLYNTDAWYMTKMVLYDGYEFEDYRVSHGSYQYFATADGNNSCTLYRNIPADTWCTLAIPFWPLTTLTKKYPSKFDAETGELTFSDVTNSSCWNNEPMLIKSTAALTSITGKRAGTGGSGSGITYGDMQDVADDVTMLATYSSISAINEFASDTKNYVLGTDNNLHRVTSAVSLKPFRAFFKLSNAVEVKANILTLNLDDDTDAIRTLKDGQMTKDGMDIFNLAGQRLQKLQKGINIVNGKKILVK